MARNQQMLPDPDLSRCFVWGNTTYWESVFKQATPGHHAAWVSR